MQSSLTDLDFTCFEYSHHSGCQGIVFCRHFALYFLVEREKHRAGITVSIAHRPKDKSGSGRMRLRKFNTLRRLLIFRQGRVRIIELSSDAPRMIVCG